MLKTFTKSIVVLACLFLVACAQKPQVKPVPEPEPQATGVVAPVLSPEELVEFNHARTLLQAGQLNDAQLAFEQLEQKFPTLAGIKTNLAIIALQKGLYEKGLNKAREARTLNPGNAEAFSVEGQALALLGDYLKAKQAYTKAVSLEPSSPYPHYGLGVLYDLYLQDFDLAEEHYASFLQFADPEKDLDAISQVKGWLKILERKK